MPVDHEEVSETAGTPAATRTSLTRCNHGGMVDAAWPDAVPASAGIVRHTEAHTATTQAIVVAARCAGRLRMAVPSDARA